MKELAAGLRKFGHLCLHILLKREGWQKELKKLYRLCREEGLTVRKPGGCKRAADLTPASLACRHSNMPTGQRKATHLNRANLNEWAPRGAGQFRSLGCHLFHCGWA